MNDDYLKANKLERIFFFPALIWRIWDGRIPCVLYISRKAILKLRSIICVPQPFVF